MTTRSNSIALAVIATAAGMAMLYFLRTILIPLVLAGFLAVLVNGLVRFIRDRWRGAPNWAVSILVACIVILSVAGAALVLAQGTAHIVKQAPALVARIEEMVERAGQALHLRKPLRLETLTGGIDPAKVAGSIVGSAGYLFSGLVLMVTYFGFIIAGRRRAGRKLAKLGGKSGGAGPIDGAAAQIASRIETYVWLQTLTGMMIAGSSGLVMFALGLDDSLFWTVVLFLLCYIPTLGVMVGSVILALFALVQFPSWWQAAAIFAVIHVAATIVGNVIYPRLQAESQNIDPIATLFALALWGFLWGLPGAFLAVPLTLIVMMICAHFPRARWLAILLSNDGNPTFHKPSRD